MIDLQTGNIMIYPDLILHSNLTFLEFKKTSFYDNQNPNKIIYPNCKMKLATSGKKFSH